MQDESKHKMGEFVRDIKAVNNQTENKIDVLKKILVKYDEFCKTIADFKGYPVTGLIEDINLAKTRRKNVGKHSIHIDFLKIKEDALFKVKHNYSIILHKI